MTTPSVNDCYLITLPKITDPRGNLSFIEGSRHIPFEIKRVFYIYDVPTEESRGAHAHRELYQFIICLSGSFDVQTYDGKEHRTVRLKRPWEGLLIPPLIWSAEINFSPGSVCLVMASDYYREPDYIRNIEDYELFISSLEQR
jgi:hypothetical protein